MFLRAWHHMLKIAKSNRPNRRRSLSAFPVELLESRCLLAATVSGTSTNPRLTLSGSESVTIENNGMNLTFALGSGTTGTLGGSLPDLMTLTITGSSSSNPITINLPALNGLLTSFRVIVNGGGGDDQIDASACDFSVSLNGGTGRDTLIGGSVNDTLDGSSNNDSLDGGGGNDRLLGGSGNDTINGGMGDDLVNGMGDNDSLMGDEGNDELYGGAGRDFLDGDDGDDLVKGQGGLDTITGSRDDAIDELVGFRNSSGRAFANLDPRDTRLEFENG